MEIDSDFPELRSAPAQACPACPLPAHPSLPTVSGAQRSLPAHPVSPAEATTHAPARSVSVRPGSLSATIHGSIRNSLSSATSASVSIQCRRHPRRLGARNAWVCTHTGCGGLEIRARARRRDGHGWTERCAHAESSDGRRGMHASVAGAHSAETRTIEDERRGAASDRGVSSEPALICAPAPPECSSPIRHPPPRRSGHSLPPLSPIARAALRLPSSSSHGHFRTLRASIMHHAS